MSDELAKKILIEATRCVNDRNWDLAINAFERLARVRPLDPKVIYNKGVAYTRLMRFSDAKADFVRAIELENNYPLARNSYSEICIKLSEIPNPLLMPAEEIKEETAVGTEPLSSLASIAETPVIEELAPVSPEPQIATPENKENIDWDKFEESGAVTIGTAAASAEPFVETTPAVEIPQINILNEPAFNTFDDELESVNAEANSISEPEFFFDDGLESSNAMTSFEGESSAIFDNAEEPVIEKSVSADDFIISTGSGISLNLNNDSPVDNDIIEFKTPLETNNLDFLPSAIESSTPFDPNISEPEVIEFKTPLETSNLDFIPIEPEKIKEPDEPVIAPFQFEEAPAPLQIKDNDGDDDDENEDKGRKIIFDLDA